MKEIIHYRFANPQDLVFIYQSLLAMVEEEGVTDRFSQNLNTLSKALFSDTPIAAVLIAEINSTAAALCLYSTSNRNFTLFESPGLYIHDLYVAPKFRRNGLATGLFKELEKIAKDRSYSRIDWLVLKKNQLGTKFYNSIKNAKHVDYINYWRIPVTKDA